VAEGLAFTHEPQRLTQADYVRLRDAYVARLAAVPGVRAVYEYGNDDYHPGFSDLDLVAVTDERLSRRAIMQLRRAVPMEDPAWRLLRNPANIIPAALFREPEIAPQWHQVLRWRAGEVLSRHQAGDERARCAGLIMVLGRLPQSVIGLAQRFQQDRWPVVSTLVHCRGVAHGLWQAEAATGFTHPEASSYIEAVHRLRQQWHARGADRYEHLIDLARDGLRLSCDLVAELDRIFLARGWTSPWAAGPVALTITEGIPLLFTSLDDMRADRFLDSLIQQRMVLLPYSALRQLLEVAAEAPVLLRRGLRRQLASLGLRRTQPLFGGLYAETLRRYIRLQAAWRDFQRVNGLRVVVCEGAWWNRCYGHPNDLGVRVYWKLHVLRRKALAVGSRLGWGRPTLGGLS